MNFNDEKIIVFKNDAVGDLTQSLKAIKNITNTHKDKIIEIYLSERSEKFNFLINDENIKFKKLNYDLNIFEKINLIFYLLKNKISNIYILTPKNFYFYLPFFCKSKFYAITIINSNKSRPLNFLLKKLFKYKVNNRDDKRIDDNIGSLIFDLCSSKKLSSYKNILNHSPQCSNLFQSNISLFKNFIHIHYKDYIFKKNGWSHSSFLKLLNKLSLKNKIILTSDFGNFDYHKIFLSNFSYLDFDNSTDKIDLKQNVHYLHNINTSDLFKLISLSKTVISPHGAMTVMASYLQKKVIDIFDVNININAFREFKPRNDNYNFLIIKSNFEKILFKINKFL